MKISELFEANQFGHQGGAYYPPKFSDGQMRGSVKDWLDAMGVEPEHVEQALVKIKASKLFKVDMPAAGLMYTPKVTGEKNGTLTFKVKRTYPKTGWTDKQSAYNVYANGQIRAISHSGMTPLKTPKPHLKAGDPVGSLVMIYTNAMNEVINKWQKASAKIDKENKALVSGFGKAIVNAVRK